MNPRATRLGEHPAEGLEQRDQGDRKRPLLVRQGLGSLRVYRKDVAALERAIAQLKTVAEGKQVAIAAAAAAQADADKAAAEEAAKTAAATPVKGKKK